MKNNFFTRLVSKIRVNLPVQTDNSGQPSTNIKRLTGISEEQPPNHYLPSAIDLNRHQA
jgi:hypothetical protein